MLKKEKKNHPDSDIPEIDLNELHTDSLILLRKIFQDFGCDSFTTKDVRDTYFAYVQRKKSLLDNEAVLRNGVRFGRDHLNYLIGQGLVNKDERTYSMNIDSPLIESLIDIDPSVEQKLLENDLFHEANSQRAIFRNHTGEDRYDEASFP